LTISVTNMRLVVADLTAAGLTNRDYVTLHALLDEGKVEVSFGEWVKASSMDNPDVKEYAQAKPRLMRHTLNRLGTPPYDHHESRNAYYRAPHRSPIDTAMLWRRIRRWHAARHPQPPPRSASYASKDTPACVLRCEHCLKIARHSSRGFGRAVRLAREWGHARRLIAIGRHQRVASTRCSFYKRKVASAIDVLTEEGEVEQVPEGAMTRIRSSFRDALARWRARRRGGAPSSQR
jgi:hypothetical protein